MDKRIMVIVALLAVLFVLIIIAFGTRNSAAESFPPLTQVGRDQYKFQDGDVTCYIYDFRGGISCLKENNVTPN